MKIWLAPLHGITHYNFRNCFVKHFHGIDCAIAPFIAAQPKDKFNPKKFPDLFPENNQVTHTAHRIPLTAYHKPQTANLSIIPQLMGNKPNDIKETIEVLQDTFGYQQFNWNIGCPMNQIVRKKRGCGVMPFPDVIEETVNEVCGKTAARFSIKMRLGMHTSQEGLEILLRLAPYSIDFLCIHPRLGIQQYEGNVDLDAFELFYQTTHHKIVYSGDINNVDFFVHLQQRFPKIENWMLGRGILQNPFLAEEMCGMRCAVCGMRNNVDRFIDFYNDYSELLVTSKNEKTALFSLKELWHYFAVFCKINENELKTLLRMNDYGTFIEKSKNIISQ
jgi:tRNA-dihydrouridine synthase